MGFLVDVDFLLTRCLSLLDLVEEDSLPLLLAGRPPREERFIRSVALTSSTYSMSVTDFLGFGMADDDDDV